MSAGYLLLRWLGASAYPLMWLVQCSKAHLTMTLKQRPTKLAMSTSANIRLMPVQHSRQRQGVRSLREMIGYAIKSG